MLASPRLTSWPTLLISSLTSPQGHCSINYPLFVSHLQLLPLYWLLPGSLQTCLRLIYSGKRKKIKILFSILPTSEVISLSLTFPRQPSFLIEFTPYPSSLFHHSYTPWTRANCLAASSIHWNSCSNDHQYLSKTQLQSLFCLACTSFILWSLTHWHSLRGEHLAMLWATVCLPSGFLPPNRNKDIGEGGQYSENR